MTKGSAWEYCQAMAIGQRALGRTGQSISAIGFGCGNQAGLLVRGEPREQVRVIARAIELGITYFDTAAQYGNGVSEQNLRRALRELKPRDALVGTKLQFGQPDVAAGQARIRELFEASLSRLGRESVDVLFYHGRIILGAGGARSLSVADMLGPVLDAFRGFRAEGRVRFLGFTGLGDTAATAQVVRPDAFDVFHCYYSAVNPSAGFAVPDGFGQQDFGGLLERARADQIIEVAGGDDVGLIAPEAQPVKDRRPPRPRPRPRPSPSDQAPRPGGAARCRPRGRSASIRWYPPALPGCAMSATGHRASAAGAPARAGGTRCPTAAG